MKNILKLTAFSTILLMLVGSFFSCKDDDKPFSTDEVIARAEAGVYSIPVISDGEWFAVVENAEWSALRWCTLANTTGNGDGVLTVNVAENTQYTTRRATIKTTSGGLTKSVVVNQKSPKCPKCIPFTEYSIEGTSCEWIKIKENEVKDDEIFIINSNQELDKYITCLEGHYPAVDFAKKTLLLAFGRFHANSPYAIPKMLMQIEHKSYELTLEHRSGGAGIDCPWQVAIIIDKIDKDSMVDMKYIRIH